MKHNRSTCAMCEKPLNRRQIYDGQQHCSRACWLETTLTRKAEALGIPRGTVFQAAREGRIRERDGYLTILSRRRCAHCGQARNIRGCSKLCTVCQADHAWCTGDKHAVRKDEMYPGDGRCRACYHKRAQAINTIQVPAGYIPLKVAAARMGYAPQTLHDAITRGWMADRVLLLGRRYFIVDQARYEAWPWAK